MQPSRGDQLTQGVLDRDLHEFLQLIRKIPRRRALHQRHRRIQQGSEAGKPDLAVRPQAVSVEMRQRVERVVGSAVGITGAMVELRKFAKNGPRGRVTQGGHQLGKSRDRLPVEQVTQFAGVVVNAVHIGRIPPNSAPSSVILPNPGDESRRPLSPMKRPPASDCRLLLFGNITPSDA